MELNLERFSPAKAELHGLVEKAMLITKDSSVGEVHEMRSLLRSTRISITRTGKAMREDAIKFQKDVIAKEKELVGIIEPEEERIAAIEDEMEKARLREERKAMLPHRKARLEAIGDGIFETDDHLLDMDGTEFEGYFNERQADKNAEDQRRIDEEKARIEEEQQKLEREKEVREREEKARQQERERLAREQKEKEQREARENAEAERKAKEERERLEREEHYQTFLKGNGYTPETAAEFHIERTPFEVRLYKEVGVFKIK